MDWDDEVPTEMQKTFKTWLAGLSVLKGVSIPRRYFETNWSECKDEVELHAFGDASLRGYGACVYLIRRVASKIVECSLVRACARVAPLQRKTLPTLELLGSLVTAQLLKSVIKSLRINDDVTYYCWTDSMVALGWIKGTPSNWKPWVGFKTVFISRQLRNNTSIIQISLVRGSACLLCGRGRWGGVVEGGGIEYNRTPQKGDQSKRFLIR